MLKLNRPGTEILEVINQRLTIREISGKLYLSLNTVSGAEPADNEPELPVQAFIYFGIWS